ncbi:hypothetical protein ACQP06_22925 [Nocardia sp. CA-136227]|uniref:hypothetical protein n=1 Tax=Nocardia sp. CA-136227 TaxID=3239979 RepID=UPI003D98FA53
MEDILGRCMIDGRFSALLRQGGADVTQVQVLLWGMGCWNRRLLLPGRGRRNL